MKFFVQRVKRDEERRLIQGREAQKVPDRQRQVLNAPAAPQPGSGAGVPP